MEFAERQDARSSNYRQATRLTRTEVDRDSPRHIDDAERPRCDANDYFAVGSSAATDFLTPISFQQKPDAITVAYIDNGVPRGATLLIEMHLAGVSVRRVEHITEDKGIN
jgi:hypothetical protein